MEVQFNRDKIIEKMLGKLILLEAQNSFLQGVVNGVCKIHNPSFDILEHSKHYLLSHYEAALSSYPELDAALLKKFRDELGL